jgi:hypothetical protein
MPAFLHWFPGLTPWSYRDLDADDWELMRAWVERQQKAGAG